MFGAYGFGAGYYGQAPIGPLANLGRLGIRAVVMSRVRGRRHGVAPTLEASGGRPKLTLIQGKRPRITDVDSEG